MIIKTYLVLYNIISCIGWSYILKLCITQIFTSNNITYNMWYALETPLKICQTLALLEIIHSIVGIVRSPVLSTSMQVSSRLFCLWMIANLSETSRTHWGFSMMVTSWSFVEVPRYLFYALNLLNSVPSVLFFLRYHLFMILYPTGALGEAVCMIKALPDFLNNKNYEISMPNKWNFSGSFYSIVIFVLILYIPGLPIMYSHMVRQRKSAYSKCKKN